MLCLCSGCYPYRQLSRPGVTGSVVDSQTGLPIVGAQVTLSGALVAPPQHPSRDPAWYIERGRSYSSHTTGTESATDGVFSISPQQHWDVWELHFSRWGTFYALAVRRDGYQPCTNMFWYPIEDVASSETITNLGKIRLERANQ